MPKLRRELRMDIWEAPAFQSRSRKEHHDRTRLCSGKHSSGGEFKEVRQLTALGIRS
jgi:hypothetical protein